MGYDRYPVEDKTGPPPIKSSSSWSFTQHHTTITTAATPHQDHTSLSLEQDHTPFQRIHNFEASTCTNRPDLSSYINEPKTSIASSPWTDLSTSWSCSQYSPSRPSLLLSLPTLDSPLVLTVRNKNRATNESLTKLRPVFHPLQWIGPCRQDYRGTVSPALWPRQ